MTIYTTALTTSGPRLRKLGAVAGLDVSGVSTVVDIGGADGQFVLELLTAHPKLRPRCSTCLTPPTGPVRKPESAACPIGFPLWRERLLRRGSRCGPVPAEDGAARLVRRPDRHHPAQLPGRRAGRLPGAGRGGRDRRFAASGWRREKTYPVGPATTAWNSASTRAMRASSTWTGERHA